MTLENEHVMVGDNVTPTHAIDLHSAQSWNGRTARVEPGDTLIVRRVGNDVILVRRERDDGTGVSDWVDRRYLNFLGAQIGDRRKLGVKPEGDEYLDPRDPRLAWFWDDVSVYAAKSQYCGVFDQILRELGLPPRKQEFTARGELNGLEVSARILASSQAEANNIMTLRLRDAIITAASQLESEE